MTWPGAWNRSNRRRVTHVGAGLPAMAVCQSTPLSQAKPAPTYLPSRSLECERQVHVNLLTLREPVLELCRVMDQHVLPGKRLRGDQA